MNAAAYFSTARERERIRRVRLNGNPPPPWTEDKVFQEFRFCNVHRENDRTTVWFRENVRSHLSGVAVAKATLIFRWFNRIETGEIIKDMLLGKWDTEEARRRLVDVKPLVTGAYMIKSDTGTSKLNGLLYYIEKALPFLEKNVPMWGHSIQLATEDLTVLEGIGPFIAYEITTDLRHTDVLGAAKDIQTWANVGPGATRGLGALFGDMWKWNRGIPEHQREMLHHMTRLLEMSRSEEYWPQAWEPWEMREVEHWLCEHAKWVQGMEGKNLKRRYRFDA